MATELNTEVHLSKKVYSDRAIQLKGGPNLDREMAHLLQHRQVAQFIGLSSACTGKHRSDGPKADNALILKPDHLMVACELHPT